MRSRATPSAAWITVTSGATGSGNGSVGFSVAANQNVASPFILNQLNMLNTATNGFVVNGGQLQFAGANPQITNAAQALLQVNAPVNFAASTTIDMQANNGAGREVQFTGPLSAGSGTTV